jgi:hypothetical protein
LTVGNVAAAWKIAAPPSPRRRSRIPGGRAETGLSALKSVKMRGWKRCARPRTEPDEASPDKALAWVRHLPPAAALFSYSAGTNPIRAGQGRVPLFLVLSFVNEKHT